MLRASVLNGYLLLLVGNLIPPQFYLCVMCHENKACFLHFSVWPVQDSNGEHWATRFLIVTFWSLIYCLGQGKLGRDSVFVISFCTLCDGSPFKEIICDKLKFLESNTRSEKYLQVHSVAMAICANTVTLSCFKIWIKLPWQLWNAGQ